MDPQFWLSRWQEGRTGFHGATVHADLVRFEDRFLSGGPHRVLVPLCGSTLDLTWLAERGHDVVGIELSPLAVEAIFETAGTPATRDTLGPFDRFVAGRLTVLRGDVFGATPELLGTFDRVWDRAAIVALDQPRRVRYASTIRALMSPGAVLLQNAFRYEEGRMEPPPFSVSEEELDGHYAGWPRELLLRETLTDGKFVERGLDSFEISRYQLVKPG